MPWLFTPHHARLSSTTGVPTSRLHEEDARRAHVARPGRIVAAVQMKSALSDRGVRPAPVRHVSAATRGSWRLYPNLNPSAAIEVNRDEIATLHDFFGHYRVSRADVRGQMPPNARFVFVTSGSGEIRMHPRYRHPVLAEGQAVRFAGEAEFRHGQLAWWSNASGNYRPNARDAEQAGLPMKSFLTHEQVRAGAHHGPTRR